MKTSALARREAVVIVASTSAAAGVATDRTGPVICDWLKARGFAVSAPVVVSDGEPVGKALRDATARQVAVVITTGGTGVSATDLTPEQTAPLLDVPLLGLPEEVRRVGALTSPGALLTRGLAGFSGGTFIMNLPGSANGVDDGLAILDTVLEHLLGQRHGTANGHHDDSARHAAVAD